MHTKSTMQLFKHQYSVAYIYIHIAYILKVHTIAYMTQYQQQQHILHWIPHSVGTRLTYMFLFALHTIPHTSHNTTDIMTVWLLLSTVHQTHSSTILIHIAYILKVHCIHDTLLAATTHTFDSSSVYNIFHRLNL